MDTSLALTALLMGLAGGPHCAAMCGAACAALGRRADRADAVASFIPLKLASADLQAPAPTTSPIAPISPAISPAQWLFQLGRLLSYSALGAVAAGSMQAVGWLSVHSASLRPVWVLVHVAAIVLGLVLLWQARQPVWLEEGARRLWARVLALLPAGRGGARGAAALLTGLAWAFLPCGLLYSALLVAALSPGLWQGAGVMALFALGSSLSLLAAPWLWQRLRGSDTGDLAIRLAGAALVASSSWALWHALVHDAAPWCVTPA